MIGKRELRKTYAQKRNLIDKDVWVCYNNKIADKLLKSDLYKSAKTVFVYVSIGSEVETLGLIDRMIADGKAVAVPLCDTKSHTMKSVLIKSRADLKRGAYNIPEPDDISNVIDKSEIDLCIVPALAFDRHGMRLGYGAGFYDRFLQGFDGISVGIAFDECIAESLPHDEFDVAVDVIISPNEFIRF